MTDTVFQNMCMSYQFGNNSFRTANVERKQIIPRAKRNTILKKNIQGGEHVTSSFPPFVVMILLPFLYPLTYQPLCIEINSFPGNILLFYLDAICFGDQTCSFPPHSVIST